MSRKEGTRYNSRWDWSTWFILGLVAACCLVTGFMDDGLWPTVICVVMLGFILLGFIGTYYGIEGDNLLVYTFFKPTAFPIAKIKEIKPTKSVLSAPAISLSHRLAISFTDHSILKSSMPLIISPVRAEEFIRQLHSINPDIKIDSSTSILKNNPQDR